MNFEEMVIKDLEACFNESEFSIEAIHYFENENEILNIIFDEESDVLFDDTEYATKNKFSGVESTIPSLQLSTEKAIHINHKSLLVIDGANYGVIEIHKQTDGTTKVYLDRE